MENEFHFEKINIYKFLDFITDGSVLGFVGGLFSFLGHFGVQIFFFLSAYGLSIQYKKWEKSNAAFILKRLKKIYFLLIIAIIYCVTLLYFIRINYGFSMTILKIIVLCTTLSSFSNVTMLSGPFWFFAVITQFYILFPILYRIIKKFESKPLIPYVIAFLLIYFLYFTIDGYLFHIMGKPYQISIYNSIIGHLPELLLGITIAQKNIKSINPITFVIIVMIFIGSQFFKLLFPLSFLTSTIIFLVLIKWIKNIRIASFMKPLTILGKFQ